MELVSVIVAANLTGQIVHCRDDPTVDLIQLVKCERILFGVEVTQVCDQDTNGVTDLAVSVGQLLEDRFGNTNVHAVVGRGRP